MTCKLQKDAFNMLSLFQKHLVAMKSDIPGSIAGIPDITIYYLNKNKKPKTIFVEIKYEKDKLSPIQQNMINKLKKLNFKVVVINEYNELLDLYQYIKRNIYE